jgi:hypothetical protein
MSRKGPREIIKIWIKFECFQHKEMVTAGGDMLNVI